MALADITTTSGNTYALTSMNGRSVIRSHSASTPSVPKTLEIAHEDSKNTSRHLLKLSTTAVTAEGLKGSLSVHIVVTDKDPNSIITETARTNLYAELAALATSTKISALAKGGLDV